MPCPSEASSVDREASGQRLQRRILIVEDHEDTLDLLVDRFLEAGYDVETATEGNQAISVALRMRPHAIILDLSMPGLDGVDILAILRSYPATMKTPVVVTSTPTAASRCRGPERHRRVSGRPGTPTVSSGP